MLTNGSLHIFSFCGDGDELDKFTCKTEMYVSHDIAQFKGMAVQLVSLYLY